MRQWLDFLRADDLPRMSRPIFLSERSHMALFGIFAGVIEGNTSAIVVAKTFHADTLLIPVVTATPMLANLLTLLWGAVLRGRPRQQVFAALAAGAIISFASVGLTDSRWEVWGGWIFVLQLALSRIFLAGLITVRTSMWGVNYPTAYRARITGRLQILRFMMGLFATAAVTQLFTANPEHYRWIYPLVGLIGMLSLVPIRGVRVRGEAAELRRLASERGDGSSPGIAENMRQCTAILRTDRPFARYCTAMFFLGSSNFMIDPVIAIVATQRLNYSYFWSSALLDLLPNLVMLFSIPFWARLFDQDGVVRFRVINSSIWTASAVFAAVGLALLSVGGLVWLALALLWASRVCNGLGRGGGSIAWNLGHLHFSSRSDADLYMGIHVGLTGIRGILMPFVAWWLYERVGFGVLIVASILGAISIELFRRLARDSVPSTSSPP